MAWILEKIVSTIDSLVRPTQRKTRVTFSPNYIEVSKKMYFLGTKTQTFASKTQNNAKTLNKRRNNSQASLPNENYGQFSNNPDTHEPININVDIFGAGGDCGETYNSEAANEN
uniref:Uncharacterized protein n=1 Tax=Glossina austeni TaxID=7395 RepID=A0A1A9V4U2_GLOAU